MYKKLLFTVGVYSCFIQGMMQEEMLLMGNKEPQNAIDFCVAIEETKTAYNTLPHYAKWCGRSHAYIDKLNTLSEDQKKHTEKQPASYFDMAICPIKVDNTTNTHTLCTDTPCSDKVDSYLVCKNFSKIHANTLYNLTHIQLPNVGLAVLPLQQIVESSPYLEELDVSNNNISVITYRSYYEPFAIEGRWRYNKSDDWKGLHRVNLSHNKLESINFDALFRLCPFIQNIDISHNTALNTITLEGSVAWQKQNDLCEPAMLCTLPTLIIKDTPLCSTEHINKIKTAYIKAMINARTSKGLEIGVGVGFPLLFGMIPLAILQFSPGYAFVNPLVPIGAGVGSALGSFGLSTGISSLIGRYCILQSEKEAIEQRAAEHIITNEAA
ncbi:MAG TPA: leucine-rich repeat domain-containing protein [Candidatus Babeliales bacterium]|jgi:hypothetical protein|nr:leucine-rich repeat domain-containing protein [Candidatus Babeliales bacterium]